MTRVRVNVMGALVDVIDTQSAIQYLIHCLKNEIYGYVCFCNVHMTTIANTDVNFREILNKSIMVAPDGAPIAWAVGRGSNRPQPRVSGPDFMWELISHLEASEKSVFLFGSTDSVISKLILKINESFPRLRIAGAVSPRFGSDLNSEAYIDLINNSGADVVFVGLGCPKQEKWMSDNEMRLKSILMGVGAAFDFHAGSIERAPEILRRFHLEWLFRLCQEPKRLWRRYLYSNARFIFGLIANGFSFKIH